MRKNLLYLVIFCISNVAGLAQATYQKLFGGIGLDRGNCVQLTADGGCCITGKYYSDTSHDNIYFLKVDSLYELQWTKIYGDIGIDEGFTGMPTADGGYILAGNTTSYGAGDQDIYVIKTDSVGDILWSKTYGGIEYEYYRENSMQKTDDGGYIILGRTLSYGAGYFDLYLIRIDQNGDTLWTKTIGGADGDQAHTIQQMSNGDFIIGASTWSYGAGAGDAWLIRTDSVGNPIWTRTYGGTDMDYIIDIEITTDGGFLIDALTRSFGSGHADIYLIRTDSIGDTLWTKTYGGQFYDDIVGLYQTADGGYITAGSTDYPSDVLIMKIDDTGDTIWTRAIGGAGFELATSIVETNDKGSIIVGNSSSFGSDFDIYLVKTDSLGMSGCNEQISAIQIAGTATQIGSPIPTVSIPGSIITIPTPIIGSIDSAISICSSVGISEFTGTPRNIIFPNPSSGIFHITSSEINPYERLIVFNALGEIVLQLESKYQQTKEIDLSGQVPGIYLIRFESGNQSQTARICLVD